MVMAGMMGGMMGGVVGRAVVEIVADNSGVDRALTGTQVKLASLAVAGFGAAVASAATFETSMVKIETLVGSSREQVQGWTSDLMDLSRETARGPRELADALFVITSAGERGANAINILEQASKAAAIGLGETATIARTVTAAMQAYGSDTLSAERATNILVGTVREGNLEASQLAGTLGSVLGPAAQLGIAFEDVGAFIATYTRLGGNAAEATTSLNAVMTTLLKPTKQAQDALASVGLTMTDVRRIASEEGLAQAIFTLTDAFEGNDEMLAQVIPNIRALRGVLAVAGNQADTFIETQQSLRGELNLVHEGMDRVSQTAEFKARQAINSLMATVTEFGGHSLPLVAGALAGVLTVLNGMPSELQQVAMGMGLVSAILPVLVSGLHAVRGAVVGVSAAMLANPVTAGLVVAGMVAFAIAARVMGGEARRAADEVERLNRVQAMYGATTREDAEMQLAASEHALQAVRQELGAREENLRQLMETGQIRKQQLKDEQERIAYLRAEEVRLMETREDHLAVIQLFREAEAKGEAAAREMADAMHDVRGGTEEAAAALAGLSPRLIATSAAARILTDESLKGIARFVALAQAVRDTAVAAARVAELEALTEIIMRGAGVWEEAEERKTAVTRTESADRMRILDNELAAIATRHRELAAEATRAIDPMLRASTDALRASYTSAMDAQLSGLERVRTASLDAHNARIAQIHRERDERLGVIDAEIAALTQERTDNRLAELQQQLGIAWDPRERKRILDQIADIERQASIDQLRQARRDIEDEARQQEEARKRELDAQMAHFRQQEDAARAAYRTQTEAWRLESEVRQMLWNGEFDRIEQLHAEHLPGWLSYYQSFADSVIGGPIGSIRAAMDAALSPLGTMGGLSNVGGAIAVNPHAAQIAAYNAHGESLKAQGAPGVVLASLRETVRRWDGIPTFGVGGFVSRPTLAVVGDRAGGEHIFGTDQLERVVERALARHQGGTGEFVIHQTIVLDGDVIDRRVERVQAWQQGPGRLIQGGR